MSIVVKKGAVKFNSIRDMARSIAAKTGEPVDRVYIRLWKRLEAGKPASSAYAAKTRKYERRKVEQAQQVVEQMGA